MNPAPTDPHQAVRPSCRACRGEAARPRFWRTHHSWALALGLLALAGLVWLRFQFALVLVVGNSMEPTFHTGDLLIVRKGTYRTAEPRRGEIVIARFRSELVVKRVVGLPGETVSVVQGRLNINGLPWSNDPALAEPALPPSPDPVDDLESTLATCPDSNFPNRSRGLLHVRPGTLSADRFAVLGDNRAMAEGLPFYAVIPREDLVGRVASVVHFR